MKAARPSEWLKRAFWALTIIALTFCFWHLEAERATVETRHFDTAEGGVTVYQTQDDGARPLVVVTHGFAGSLQMMQYISRDLARAGFTVAAFDFYGHGRNETRLSRDITRIEGTTQQLVEQTHAVIDALEEERGVPAQMALLGHSMATDIIIRAGQDMPNLSAVVAISMYSEAITSDYPRRLLVISGEWEDRLRVAGLNAVAQIDAEGVEGQTVGQGEVVRRTVYTPRTEHVAVLFAQPTLDETRLWLQSAFGVPNVGQAMPQGLYILLLLAGILVLSAPLARLLPARHWDREALGLRVFLTAVFLPVAPACAAAVLLNGPVAGSAAFGGLAWFFGVWGAVALVVMMRAGARLPRPDVRGVALLLVWGLAVFALALDRYGAAFLPTGARLPLMATLLPACVIFALADRLLVRNGRLWQRLLARVVPVAALAGCMVAASGQMGLLFTVLPVMVLFYGVYGTMARFVAKRQGPTTAGLALGVILAWSIAASTPLFIG
ncbi:MAG: alpha/beta fold hydrolase [Roseobacter sp.]|jgi:pimeloyl-ACP methyl ester carboxylesterase|nr:alpha/beta fold hydrolase [Roseobacter sp.]